jgi:membrane-associated protein
MSSIFQGILGSILIYKYPMLFAVAFFSCLGVPLPAGFGMIASAAFASQGYLNIGLVLIAGIAGNIIGDFAAYGLVRKYGIWVLYWFRLGKVVESQLLKKIESVENTYRATVITASRFQTQATTVVNIVAGLGSMKFRHFAFYVVIGEILQISFYGSIGYFFADNWQSLYNTVGVFSWLIILGTAIITFSASQKIVKWILK